jgi:hypothetical protein
MKHGMPLGRAGSVTEAAGAGGSRWVALECSGANRAPESRLDG